MWPNELMQIAARQHGVFNYGQAVAVGLRSDQLSRLTNKGQLQRPLKGVYVVNGSRPSWEQAVAIGVLSVPNGLASHRTAAVLRGLDGVRAARIEVLTEHGSHRRRDVTVHQTKDLVAADVDSVAGIPCTSLVRTLVDLPAVIDEFTAGKALDHACRNDRTVLRQVRARHLEVARRGRNGTVALRAMLERRLDGALVDSGFETLAVDLLREARLPEPSLQWKVVDRDFEAHLDLAWPQHFVGMECDSLTHHFGEDAHQRDRTRRRRLKLLGWDIYEYTYDDVRLRPGTVAREIRAALAARSMPKLAPPAAHPQPGSPRTEDRTNLS